jgi:hypothetical protein
MSELEKILNKPFEAYHLSIKDTTDNTEAINFQLNELLEKDEDIHENVTKNDLKEFRNYIITSNPKIDFICNKNLSTECSICSETFLIKENLGRHGCRYHPKLPLNGKFQCCKRTFKNSYTENGCTKCDHNPTKTGAIKWKPNEKFFKLPLAFLYIFKPKLENVYDVHVSTSPFTSYFTINRYATLYKDKVEEVVMLNSMVSHRLIEKLESKSDVNETRIDIIKQYYDDYLK